MLVKIGNYPFFSFDQVIIVSSDSYQTILNFKDGDRFFIYDTEIKQSTEPYNFIYDGLFLRDSNGQIINLSCDEDYEVINSYCEIEYYEDQELIQLFLSQKRDDMLDKLSHMNNIFSYCFHKYEESDDDDEIVNHGFYPIVSSFLSKTLYNEVYVDKLLRMRVKLSLTCLNYMLRLFPHFLVKMKDYGWFENPDFIKNSIIFTDISELVKYDECTIRINSASFFKLKNGNFLKREFENLGYTIDQ